MYARTDALTKAPTNIKMDVTQLFFCTSNSHRLKRVYLQTFRFRNTVNGWTSYIHFIYLFIYLKGSCIIGHLTISCNANYFYSSFGSDLIPYKTLLFHFIHFTRGLGWGCTGHKIKCAREILLALQTNFYY